MTKTPQVKPDWNTGIYIGNGVVAEPKPIMTQQQLDDLTFYIGAISGAISIQEKDLENKNIEQAISKNKDMRKTIERAKSILGRTI